MEVTALGIVRVPHRRGHVRRHAQVRIRIGRIAASPRIAEYEAARGRTGAHAVRVAGQRILRGAAIGRIDGLLIDVAHVEEGAAALAATAKAYVDFPGFSVALVILAGGTRNLQRLVIILRNDVEHTADGI